MNNRYHFTKNHFFLIMLVGLCFSFSITSHTNKNRLFNILFNSHHIALTVHKATWKHDTKKNHPYFLKLKKRPVNVYGVDQYGHAVSTDTGKTAPGCEQFSLYVSEYLAQVLDAIGNFRNVKLQKSITWNWIRKFCQLEIYVNELGFRLAYEIGISRQIGFFEPDLISRLQNFRERAETIIGSKIPLFIDLTELPKSIPGYSLQEEILSLKKAIDIAVEYWHKICRMQPSAKQNDYFTEFTLSRLLAIKKNLDASEKNYESLKKEIFASFTQLEKLESHYTYVLTDGEQDYQMLVNLGWVLALTPKLRLERLLSSTFEFQILGGRFIKNDHETHHIKNVYKYVVLTNIPGIMLGFDDQNTFRETIKFFDVIVSNMNDLARQLCLKQLFTCGELKLANSKKNIQYLTKELAAAAITNNLPADYDGIDLPCIAIGCKNLMDCKGKCSGHITFFDDNFVYAESMIMLKSSLDNQQKILTLLHETSHAITKTSFIYINNSGQNEFYIQLTPQKRIRWSLGEDEQIAVGCLFFGENPFFKKNTVSSIGWITQNDYLIQSKTGAPYMFYLDSKVQSATTSQLHIPNIITNKTQQSFIFFSNMLFPNLKDVFLYLNRIQILIQEARTMHHLLERDSLKIKFTEAKQHNIASKLKTTMTFLQKELPKIAQAIVLAQYESIYKQIQYLKGIDMQEQFEGVVSIKNQILSFAALLGEQFSDTILYSEYKALVLEEIPKQYARIFCAICNNQQLTQALTSTESDDQAFNLHKPKMILSIDKPYGLVSQMHGMPEYIAKKAFNFFATELSIPPQIKIHLAGNISDYIHTLFYFTQHKRVGSRIKMADTILHAFEVSAMVFFSSKGDATPLAAALLFCFVNLLPDCRSLLRKKQSTLILLSELTPSNNARVVVDSQIQNELHSQFTVFFDENIPEVDRYKLTSSERISYFDKRNRLLPAIPNVIFL